MAIEKFQFMDRDNAALLANELIKYSNIRIGDRIVKSIDANSTDKQMPSARLLYKLLGELEASKTAAAGRLDTNGELLEEHAGAIEDLTESQGVQGGKLDTVEGTLADTSTLVDELVHFTIETVEGTIDTVTEPSTTVFYLQRDNAEDKTWNIYIYTEDLGFIGIGDTEIDLSHIWSKDEVEEMREALQVHEAEGISLDRLAAIVDEQFADTEVSFVPVQKVEVPTLVVDQFTYNGTELTPEFVGYDETKMTMSGDTSATDAGTYTVTFTLKDGYKWVDETTDPKEVVWVINEPNYQPFTVTKSNRSKVGYTGAENEELVIPATFVDPDDGLTYKVVEIGEGAFEQCDTLLSVVIPEGVTSIGDSAFGQCSFRTVTIPISVTNIGVGAFYDIALNTIYYAGSEEQWNSINIGDYNDLNIITKVYNYQG